MALPMTRSVLTLARQARAIARSDLPRYSAVRSRKDFTQDQLFAILTVREFLQMDYRSLVQLLAEWSDLRKAIGLRTVPHYTTLQKAHARMLKKGLSTASSTPSRPGR
jgi:hypothetical protein